MAAAAETNPRLIIRESKMRAFQWVAIGLCVAMTALDGFDVLSVAYVGPELAQAWGVSNVEQANFGNAGIIGMIFGSLIFAPIADVIGRRNVLLVSLGIITVGMFASAATESLAVMAAGTFGLEAPPYKAVMLGLRLFTGFGIGTMFAPVNSMAAEYANDKGRGVAIGLNVLGYPLGTTVGGLISTYMLADSGPNLAWPSVFILGGVLTAALIPLTLLLMPESMEFLLSKRPKNALKQVNVVMKKLGHAPLAQLPPPDAEAQKAGGLGEILKQPYLARVIILIVAYFMTISVFYFGNFLLPRVLSQPELGFNPTTARIATIAITVGGMIGSLTFGFLAARFRFQNLTTLVCVMGTVMTSIFGLMLGNVTSLMIGAILLGFFINAGIAGFYTGMAASFPAHLRATGTGFTLGVGRVGALVAPIVGGLLLDGGMPLGKVYLIVGATMLISALFMQFLRVEDRKGAPGAAQTVAAH